MDSRLAVSVGEQLKILLACGILYLWVATSAIHPTRQSFIDFSSLPMRKNK
jgi:hypothetical protein